MRFIRLANVVSTPSYRGEDLRSLFPTSCDFFYTFEYFLRDKFSDFPKDQIQFITLTLHLYEHQSQNLLVYKKLNSLNKKHRHQPGELVDIFWNRLVDWKRENSENPSLPPSTPNPNQINIRLDFLIKIYNAFKTQYLDLSPNFQPMTMDPPETSSFWNCCNPFSSCCGGSPRNPNDPS